MVKNPKNKKLVDTFLELIKYKYKEHKLLLSKEEKNTNGYKIEALCKNLRYLGRTSREITSVEDLKNIKGFGPGTLSRINEILKTGKLKEIEILQEKTKNLENIKKLVDEMTDVIGIGDITAINLINTHRITSMKDFLIRVKTGDIKVNDKIKLGLKYSGKFEKSIRRDIITEIFNNIKRYIKDSNTSIDVCGSYRRGLAYSSDIDILICDKSLNTMIDAKNSNKLKDIVKKLKSKNLITDDITDKNVKTKYMGFTKHNNKLYRIDMRLVSKNSYYTALLYFTGSYYFNITMRKKAKKMFYTLNEYEIKNVMGQMISVNSEKEIFDILKMKYLAPEERNL